MLIRYQTQDGKNHEKEVMLLGGSGLDEEGTAVAFLASLGANLNGATLFQTIYWPTKAIMTRKGNFEHYSKVEQRPIKSFAYTPEKGLHQTNP